MPTQRNPAKTVFWFVVRWTPHARLPQWVAGPYDNEADATAASRTAVMSGSVVTLMSTVPQEVIAPTELASSTLPPLPAAPYPDEQQQPYSGPEPGRE